MTSNLPATIEPPRTTGPVRDARGRVSGGNPGNTGGKRGRSGRKPDAFRALLAELRDDAGLVYLRELIEGRFTYAVTGVCQHCRKESKGPSDVEIVSLTPGPDTRLRAVDLTMKYTIPRESIVTLSGIDGVRRAFDVIKARIRSTLAPEMAASLINDIEYDLKKL